MTCIGIGLSHAEDPRKKQQCSAGKYLLTGLEAPAILGLMRFLIKIVANSLGILIASLSVPGFVFDGNIVTLILAGCVLALANAIVRPILKLLSFPLIILTLGLFSIVINMLVLKLVDYAIDSLSITFGALFLATILISIINGLWLGLLKKNEG